MFGILLLEITNIDKMNNRWPARILFVFMVLVNSFMGFLPEEYSDFSAVMSWLDKFQEASYNERIAMYSGPLPITNANLIFMFLSFAVIFINIMIMMLYAGIFIRDYRFTSIQVSNDNVLLRPIKVSSFVGRYILLFLWMCFISVPLYIISVYLFLIVIFIVPILMLIPVGYLSGDYDFFESVGAAIKNIKGNYFITSRFLSVIVLIYLVLSFVTSGLYQIFPIAYIIVDAFVVSWALLSVSRLAVVTYTDAVVKIER